MVVWSNPNRALQSATVEASLGSSCNARQIGLRRGSAGWGSDSGKAGRMASSSRIRCMIRASRESSAYGGFKLTEALISSLSSGETVTVLGSAGRLGKLSGRTNTLRIFSVPTQRSE